MLRRPLLAAGLLAGGALLRPAILRAQAGSQGAAGIGSAARPLSIGVTAGPHAQVTEKVRELAASRSSAIDYLAAAAMLDMLERPARAA